MFSNFNIHHESPKLIQIHFGTAFAPGLQPYIRGSKRRHVHSGNSYPRSLAPALQLTATPNQFFKYPWTSWNRHPLPREIFKYTRLSPLQSTDPIRPFPTKSFTLRPTPNPPWQLRISPIQNLRYLEHYISTMYTTTSPVEGTSPPTHRPLRSLSNKPRFPPPHDYPECLQQFHSFENQKFSAFEYEKRLTVPEAKALVAQYTETISKARTYLKEQFDARAGAIARIWKSKTSEERAAVLSRAQPTLEKFNYFEVRSCFAARGKDISTITRAKMNSWLAPSLNAEILSTVPEHLLSLFRFRVESTPAEWVSSDNRVLNFPWSQGCLSTTYLRAAVLVEDSGYGRLIDWSTGAAHARIAVGWPRANLLFEAQAYCMHTLEISIKIISSEAQSIPANLQMHTPTPYDPSSFESQSLDRCWRPCPTFNVREVTTFSQGRLKLVGDHIWQLQTNPEYFRSYIEPHSLEAAQRVTTNLPPNYAAALDLYQDLQNHRVWISIYLTLFDIEQLELRGPSLSFFEQLELCGHLATLEEVLKQLITSEAHNLKIALSLSPGFGHMFTYTVTRQGTVIPSFKILPNETQQTTEHALYRHDPLLWIFLQITKCCDEGQPMETWRCLEFLRCYLNDSYHSSPQELVRIDEGLDRKFINLSTMYNILTDLQARRPRIEQYPEQYRTPVPDLRKCAERITKALALEPLPEDFESMGDDEGLLLHKNTHKAMKNYWDQARETLREQLRKRGVSERSINGLMDNFSMDKKPEYKANYKASRAVLHANIRKRLASSSVPSPALASSKPSVEVRNESFCSSSHFSPWCSFISLPYT